VVCNNLGLGVLKERTTLFSFEGSGAMNSLYRRQGIDHLGLCSGVQEEPIEITTLDEYCRVNSVQKIDLLKIDVEGHELAVLQGARSALQRGAIKFIQFEYGGCNIDSRVFLRDIWDYLTDFQYTLYKLYPTHCQPFREYSQALDNFQYQNWAAAISGELLK